MTPWDLQSWVRSCGGLALRVFQPLSKTWVLWASPPGLAACLGEAGAARGKGDQADQHSEPQCHPLKFPIMRCPVSRPGLGPQTNCLPSALFRSSSRPLDHFSEGHGCQTSPGVPVSQARGEGPENIALRRQDSQVSMIVQFSNLSP